MKKKSKPLKPATGAARHEREPVRRDPRHRPKKRFGQHFLEPAWSAKLVELVAPSPSDVIVEIGPGTGALSHRLAARAGQFLAIEIDRELAAALAPQLPPHGSVLCADFLRVDLASLLGATPTCRVVGNLPYNVSSPILFSLMATAIRTGRLTDATLMLQKEVADRLAAQPGTPDYGPLAVQMAYAADVSRLLVLPPGAFRPPPTIWSAVVQLRFRPAPFQTGPPAVFERVVRGVFLQRRKTLANALKPVAQALGCSSQDLLDRSGLDGSRRPEMLTPAEFGLLATAVL